MNWGRIAHSKSKYGNSKVKKGDLTFDSQLEYQHFLVLFNRFQKGEIKDFARQVRIELTTNAKSNADKVFYVADFVFYDNALQSWIVWDSKGMKTDTYIIKRKWLLDTYCGFLFIEHTSKEQKQYTPSGGVPLKFLQN